MVFVKTQDGQKSNLTPQELLRMPVNLERDDSHGQFRDHHGNLKPRTFTSRPSHGLARTMHKADFTHNSARLVDIATETRSLVHRLENVYNRPVGQAIAKKSPPRGKPCNEAPTSRNRLVSLFRECRMSCLLSLHSPIVYVLKHVEFGCRLQGSLLLLLFPVTPYTMELK